MPLNPHLYTVGMAPTAFVIEATHVEAVNAGCQLIGWKVFIDFNHVTGGDRNGGAASKARVGVPEILSRNNVRQGFLLRRCFIDHDFGAVGVTPTAFVVLATEVHPMHAGLQTGR